MALPSATIQTQVLVFATTTAEYTGNPVAYNHFCSKNKDISWHPLCYSEENQCRRKRKTTVFYLPCMHLLTKRIKRTNRILIVINDSYSFWHSFFVIRYFYAFCFLRFFTLLFCPAENNFYFLCFLFFPVFQVFFITGCTRTSELSIV